MLDELRTKDKMIREQYAFWGALVITLGIAAVWFTFTLFNFKTSSEIIEVDAETASSTAENTGAFAQFFQETFGNIITSFKDLKEEATSEINSISENQNQNNNIEQRNETQNEPVKNQVSSEKAVLIATSSIDSLPQ